MHSQIGIGNSLEMACAFTNMQSEQVFHDSFHGSKGATQAPHSLPWPYTPGFLGEHNAFL